MRRIIVGILQRDDLFLGGVDRLRVVPVGLFQLLNRRVSLRVAPARILDTQRADGAGVVSEHVSGYNAGRERDSADAAWLLYPSFKDPEGNNLQLYEPPKS